MASRVERTPHTSGEELGDGGGGGVGGGTEGGAARRGHALAVVWAEVCCTDVRRRSTRRECPRDIVWWAMAQVDNPSQAFPVNPVKNVMTLSYVVCYMYVVCYVMCYAMC